jgi:hypothetical protein
VCGKARRKETTRNAQDVGVWIILKWILEIYDGGYGLDSSGLG